MQLDPRPVRPYRQIADQILALISAQGIAPGDRLPAERDLAERLSVSRPALREALIALDVEGHVQIRMGSGIYVSDPAAPGEQVDSEGPFEIMQARAIVESAIAEEAAARADDALIATLDQNLRQMAEVSNDAAQSIRLDGAFHVAIATAAGNNLLRSFTSEIFRKRLTPLFERLASHFETPPTWRSALDEHRAIRDALAARDPARAREAMRTHLTRSQRRFQASFGADQM
ncbi:MAG: FadR/GntR family transcriptional regulator [Paracoccus sp. (in: a-proteobacteria)]|nr:FadR/GntR family transcriptional regulator [Paracoccus sp. (in: a-proteobacteria)]